MRRKPRGAVLWLFCIAPILSAQESKTAIDQAWDSILSGSTTPGRAAAALPAGPSWDAGSQKFLDHFFFESRTEYERYGTSFTGLPTITGVINAPFTGVFNPNGIPYPPAFQPNAGRAFEFLDFGTRGWLSERVNTHFALRYEQDLSHVDAGAPAQNILETFASNRRLDIVSASLELKMPAGTSLQVGRQYVYGAELAALDGAAFTVDRAPFSLTLFGGRRFTFFGDPQQRAIGGANLLFRLHGNASLEYQGLWYIKGTNSLVYRQRIGGAWLVSSFLRAYGGAPVDFSAQALYSARNGKSLVRLSFFQKLTDKDYLYDYTIAARDRGAYSSVPRLYLGPFAPFSQFVAEARRTVAPGLRIGGTVWVRRLNNTNDQSAFDTSFQDYRFDAQWLPRKKLEAFLEYHQHDSDRLSPLNATTFDDVSRAGETSVKDLSGEIGRSFAEGTLRLSGGAYYRRISLQDRFFTIQGLHQAGWLVSAWWRLDRHTRLYADYNLDNDFFLFRPDLKNSRALRLGVSWRY